MSVPGPLDRRLVFVVGKGGVGKSTVAAALALALARRGRRVLLASLSGSPAALGPTSGVSTATVDGEAAFAEYLGTILPASLARRLAASRLIQRFVATAPGLRELMAMGKVAHEERRCEAGRPVWDAVVVDTPATGHALDLLRMPAAAAAAFGGLVRQECERILAQLRAPERTAVWLVSTPEELPARETIEAVAELRERLGLPLGALVVNAIVTAPLVAEQVPRPGAGAPALAVQALACAREQAEWAALHRRWTTLLLGELALPSAQLARVGESPGLAELAQLGAELERQLGGRP